MLAAVVLAGNTGKDAEIWGVPQKAHIKIGNISMARVVLAALTKSATVSHISYVGQVPDDAAKLVQTVVSAGVQMSDSLRCGLESVPSDTTRILLLTADLPWLNAQHISRFIEASPDADIVYPIIPRAVTEAAFPKQKRTYARVQEGEFTGGNLFLLKPRAVASLLSLSDQIYAGRKNPLALARLVGLRTVLGIATGRARIATLEARASRLLGVEARAQISQDAALGADVDKPEHLKNIEA